MKKLYLFLFLNFLFARQLFAQSNQYLHFDGQDDFVQVNNIASELDGATQISMTGWFLSDELRYGAGMLSIRGGGTGDTMYILELNNGKLECRMFVNGNMYQYIAPAGTVQAGVWQHYAWVWEGNSVKFYLNGNLLGSSSASGGSFSGIDKPFTIGKSLLSGYNFVYKGGIDEVSLWKKALTQSEIQNMIANELNGTETDLIAYYKFNQGIPGDDNTFIDQLLSETNTYPGDLHNFALQGQSSNFIGTLEPGFQVINFPRIPDKVTTDPPFDLQAYTSSGLPVSYEVVSGPASISGNTVTLNGTPGEVVIKASQPGDAQYAPAQDVYSSFHVWDAATVLPVISFKNPVLNQALYMNDLIAVPVAITVEIDHPEVFSVQDFNININGTNLTFTNHDDYHYTALWTPTSAGSQNVHVTATNNYGFVLDENYSFDVVLNNANDLNVVAADDVILNNMYYSQVVEAELPAHLGAFDNITATFSVECPTGGCDPWDRASYIHVQGHDGKWHEIIRYITPYGVPCSHEIDLTDFSSLLSGKVKFRFTLATNDTGYLYNLVLDYHAGQPDFPYSRVNDLWTNTYPFGDMANLQPCESYDIDFPANTEAAKIKLVSTGHGWGQNNTGNAAEFHHDVHHIRVNGVNTFEQDNWVDCNPNPDGCQPQNGTWYYDRAGWCPGSIAQWFDFELNTPDLQNTLHLDYVFDEDYVDYCHPNNPNCVSGQTCPDCDDGFNPHLIVASHLISFSSSPLEEPVINIGTSGMDETYYQNDFEFLIMPNPTKGKFLIQTYKKEAPGIFIYDEFGKLIWEKHPEQPAETYAVDISFYPEGIYLVKIINSQGTSVRKIIKY